MKNIIESVTSAETAIDLIVYIERFGQNFYKSACEKTNNDKVREVFRLLADDENQHLDHFKQLQELVSIDHTSTTHFIAEYGHFLEMISEGITSDLFFSRDMSSTEVVNMALRFEKDTLILLNELKKLFTGKKSCEIVETVCKDEKKHFLELN
ncbi:ferritin family protein, partial [bacterium]|nr:ferritin family protein [bacterium]